MSRMTSDLTRLSKDHKHSRSDPSDLFRRVGHIIERITAPGELASVQPTNLKHLYSTLRLGSHGEQSFNVPEALLQAARTVGIELGDVEKDLLSWLSDEAIEHRCLLLTGLRGCGKSTLLH